MRLLTYGDCPIDVALTEDTAKQNLILVGNAATNRVWRRFDATTGVAFEAEGMRVAGEYFRGSDLSVQCVVAHPLNAEGSIVLLGAGDASAMDFGTLELAECGWFDYAVWRPTPGGLRLVAAKNLDAPGKLVTRAKP